MGISKYLVADAWFSKKPFTDQIVALEMHLISRLRDDADLKYLYKGPHTGKKGRPPNYDGKIISNDIDKEYFRYIPKSQRKGCPQTLFQHRCVNGPIGGTALLP